MICRRRLNVTTLIALLTSSAALAQPLPIAGGGTGATNGPGALSNLGALGTSVNLPGTTTTLQALVPIQTQMGATYNFGCGDMFQKTLRSNSASSMSDSLPASGACMGNGTQLEISNVDASAADTITAGGSTSISGNATIVVAAGRDLWLSYDAANSAWRPLANSDTAILSSQVALGVKNTAFGLGAGILTTGSYNTFLGSVAGAITTGSNNELFGYEAGYSNTSGFNNLFIGDYAGYLSDEGSNNVYIGRNAGHGGLSKYTTGNVALGVDAGFTLWNPTYSPTICNTTSAYCAENNVYIGYQAGYNSYGADNIFIGKQAGFSNGSANYNLFIGYETGYNNTSGQYNNFVGRVAGNANTTGSYNDFFGNEAGYVSSGSYNDFIGFEAGYYDTGNYNDYYGYQTGLNNLSGSNNAMFGAQAGFNSTSSNDVAVGMNAGYADTGGANTFVGFESGYNNKAGTSNVAIGWEAGLINTTGYNLTFLGASTNASSATNLNDSTAVGNAAEITASHQVVLGASTTTQLVTPAAVIPNLLYSAGGTPALPACVAALKGEEATVSDATAPTFNGTYTSGGTLVAKILCNGTNWVTF